MYRAIDIRELSALSRNPPRELLREIGLAARPAVDPVHQCAAGFLVETEAGGEAMALRRAEIGQLDRAAVGERRPALVRTKPGRRADSENDEIEPMEIGIGNAARVTGPNGGKQFPGEWQRFGTLDLVDKDRDGLERMRENDLREELD